VLSFSSLGITIDESVWGPMGIYTFRIQGDLCHRIGSLLPIEGEQPKFAQIYVADHDPSRQVQQRLIYGNGNLNQDILRCLQDMLQRVNPYYETFKTAIERMQNVEGLHLHLTSFDSRRHDPRRYNLPTAAEVGVIMVGDGSETTEVRDIIIEKRSGQLQRISELHSGYLPLRFPLLFPYGEPGWHDKIPFALNDIANNTYRSGSNNDVEYSGESKFKSTIIRYD